mgnify:CR=1 FL=1
MDCRQVVTWGAIKGETCKNDSVQYRVRNSFYEITSATMWNCTDTVRDITCRQDRVSKLRDKPLSTVYHSFDE